MSSTQKLLRELVALPSVNPAFLPRGHQRAGEHRVADFLAAFARKAGLEVELKSVFTGRANLIARLHPAGAIKQRIVLAPHLDTVDIADERQLSPRVSQGRLYGRGACDTKGSVAAMMSALAEVARAGGPPPGVEIVFAGLVDEEDGQGGSRALARTKWRVDLAIVGEPTRSRVVTCHKGDMWLKLETRGRSAHSSRPHLGVNAIEKMARVVNWLENRYSARLKRRRHPVLGCGTVNVGTITGGVQPNIVPDRCGITIDRRTLPGETARSVLRELAALLKQEGLDASLASIKAAPCLPMETDAALPLVQRFLRAARQARPEGVDYYCDASVLAEAGIPSVVFGPGDIAQAHTADEWISLESLERAKDLLVKFLRG